MIPFFLFFYLSGEIAINSIIFGSLIFHELGHLLAAKVVGVKVYSCTILPYGGEIKIEQFSKRRRKDQLIIILGGPLFTFLLLFLFYFFDFPQKELLLKTQLIILGLNLLPIYPLDGGRALLVIWPANYVGFITYSLFSSFLIFYVSLFHFPKALAITVVFLFLIIQNYSYWRFRKYKLAFDKITNSS